MLNVSLPLTTFYADPQDFPELSNKNRMRYLQRMPPLCDVKTALLMAYQHASIAYSKAVSELSHYAGTIPRVEYERLRVVTERAREACTAAREALQVHTCEHGC